jgi:hypothetical protein
MIDLFVEIGAELLPVLVRAVAAGVLTLLGMAVELNALSTLADGELVFGGWLLYLGAVALYGGLFVVGPDALARLADLTADTA